MVGTDDITEIYVSSDIESDGPAPGLNSMLNFGSAAYLADKTIVGTFSANLEVLEEASADPLTMVWWESQPLAWQACRSNPQPPGIIMPQYAAWLKGLPGKLVFVGYPAMFDFMFITYYLHRFAGESPFLYFALDIKTYAMALLKKDLYDVDKDSMPKHWFDDLPYTHIALDDAVSQGALFCNMLVENMREISHEAVKAKP